MRTAIIALMTLMVVACQSLPREQKSIESDMVQSQDTTSIRGTGTIVFNDFEGGFFGIVSDSGERYYAGALEEAFQQDGLRVRFVLRPLRDVMTTVMWGRAAEVVRLEQLDDT